MHSVCISCWGVDCHVDNCCTACTDVDDVTMTEYVKHRLSLKRKLLSKRKLRDPLLSISTLPSHIYSTILLFAEVTCNTHKNKKLLSIPLKLVPSLAKLPLPYFPPSTGRSVCSHPKLVIPFFGAVLGGSPARRFPYFRS